MINGSHLALPTVGDGMKLPPIIDAFAATAMRNSKQWISTLRWSDFVQVCDFPRPLLGYTSQLRLAAQFSKLAQKTSGSTVSEHW
jgi:hypothetical protein